MSIIEHSEQEIQRREKLTKLRALGINPYPAILFPVSDYSTDLKKNFEEGKNVCIAGRMMSQRDMGKASFAEIQDSKGRIQVYLNRDEICPGDDKTIYNTVFKKLLDLGDFIGIKGSLFKTKVGEISIKVNEMTLLSKSLKPLPLPKTDANGEIHDAFTDPETRYRQRYTDLIVNPHVKNVFIKRGKLMHAMRSFFIDKGYHEIETPILQAIPGGASARPFITHHNTLNVPMYLRIACELYLKKTLIGGFDGVFEFAKTFRNEGMDRTHNPEFSMMEIYVAYKDYNWMMDFTENLLEHCAISVNGSTKVTFGDHKIDFKAPYKKVTMRQSIIDFTQFDIKNKSEDDIHNWCINNDIEVDKTMGKGKLIDEIFGKYCEKNYIDPTFIIDYPKEMSPLCKEHRDDSSLTERFELIVCGKELANAYTELNDPIDQKKRFEDQLKLAERGDEEAGEFIDYDFLRSLEYGMPPTSGMGIGIDRLTMFLTNNQSIQEVILFPQMKPEVFIKKGPNLSENEKIIFDLLSKEKSIELNSLKEACGLSNKKWDLGLKALRNYGLTRVIKEEDSIIIEIINQ
ncbi:MAG: lysine--tRNA ligase [Crocinitomicaceae bacterium]|nr:lysine--tRNA ligase [Crocinitomicaceae bacterium]|tara:strand:+ start:29269 stop:30984 length:1716 start_codon:yes stop_codon:yes gene_type:complete